ncbi:FxsA family protein [Candidatus Pelagibacter sp. HIMB1506]|uniref:FxsA family protein n=1 Tax=Candidatus Pelagibacter sp. HIMB1506 TaxID=3413337 RepID=UPI003F84E783
MNPILISIILIPIVEIFLFIKIGAQIGAFSTIFLIFITAIIGIYYAKYEGLNTLKSGFLQINNNRNPTYEVMSGAAIAVAAILLIIPGFASDLVGFILIFPLTRKYLIKKIFKNFDKKKYKTKSFIDGEYEEIIEEDDERKI